VRKIDLNNFQATTSRVVPGVSLVRLNPDCSELFVSQAEAECCRANEVSSYASQDTGSGVSKESLVTTQLSNFGDCGVIGLVALAF
jgi:hypothetical protein